MSTITLATQAAAKQISEIYGDVVSTSAITFDLTPPTELEFEERIASIGSYAPWLVCAKNNEVLGYAYASKHRDRAAYQWSVDFAVYVRNDCHRRGVGRALYASLIECVRLQGFYAAHAGITLPNAGSVGLHESLGFRLIGVYPAVGYKLGAWRDVGWWQLALRERVGVPTAPRTLSAAVGDTSWIRAIETGISFLRV